MLNPFSERTISFNVSIGTGIALESVFDPEPEVRYDKDRVIPNTIKPDDYKYHIYNIYTLARNILSACTIKDKFQLINNEYFLPTVTEEIENIKILYQGFKVIPVLYIPDYSKQYTRFNNQKSETITNSFIDYDTMRKIFKKISTSMDTITDTKLPPTNEKVLIMTNYALDLLNYTIVPKLDLLESHTGKIKTRSQFNSKYHPIGKRDMSVFPFTEKLLFILGDKTIVKPSGLKIRVDLHKLAEENNWNNKTTNDKIMYWVNKNLNIADLMKKF